MYLSNRPLRSLAFQFNQRRAVIAIALVDSRQAFRSRFSTLQYRRVSFLGRTVLEDRRNRTSRSRRGTTPNRRFWAGWLRVVCHTGCDWHLPVIRRVSLQFPKHAFASIHTSRNRENRTLPE